MRCWRAWVRPGQAREVVERGPRRGAGRCVAEAKQTRAAAIGARLALAPSLSPLPSFSHLAGRSLSRSLRPGAMAQCERSRVCDVRARRSLGTRAGRRENSVEGERERDSLLLFSFHFSIEKPCPAPPPAPRPTGDCASLSSIQTWGWEVSDGKGRGVARKARACTRPKPSAPRKKNKRDGLFLSPLFTHRRGTPHRRRGRRAGRPRA